MRHCLQLDHDIEVVWALVMGGKECHPFCRSNEAIEREFFGCTHVPEWESAGSGSGGYDLVIMQSFVMLNEAGNRSTELRITVYPYLLSGLPRIISAIPFSIYARPKLTTYLRSVLGGFEWTTGRGFLGTTSGAAHGSHDRMNPLSLRVKLVLESGPSRILWLLD